MKRLELTTSLFLGAPTKGFFLQTLDSLEYDLGKSPLQREELLLNITQISTTPI